jgi:hypothetical protein
VSTSYTRLYAPLRNQIFHSLAEVNTGLRQQLIEHQNREGTRLPSGARYHYQTDEAHPPRKHTIISVAPPLICNSLCTGDPAIKRL